MIQTTGTLTWPWHALVEERRWRTCGLWQHERGRGLRQISPAGEGSALQHCQKCAGHQDLKAEHWLLDTDMNIRTMVLGFSDDSTFGQKLGTFSSLPYAAWEHLRGEKYEGSMVDTWGWELSSLLWPLGPCFFTERTLKMCHAASMGTEWNL